MPSREIRRSKDKEKQKKAEISQNKHPVFYVLSIAVLIIIVIAFIFGGSGSGNTREQTVFGKYNGKNIEWIQDNFFDGRRDYYGQLYSQQNSQNQDQSILSYQSFQQAFDDTVNLLIVLDKAKKSGYQVDRMDLVDQIRNHPTYADEYGQFDLSVFDNTNAITRNIIEKSIEEQLLAASLMDDALFQRKISRGEIETYKNLMSKERSFNYVSFSFDDFPKEKIIEYGKENEEKFRKVRLGRIYFSGKTKEEVETLRNRIAGGERSFEDMAREHSTDVHRDQGGDMGFQYFHQIVEIVSNDKTVANSIIELPLNSVSAVIPNGDDFVVFTTLSEPADPDFEDETTIDDIYSYMKDFERNIIENQAKDLAQDFQKKAQAKGMAEACSELKLKGPFTTNSTPINYLSLFSLKTLKSVEEDAPSIGRAQDSTEFFETAFALKDKEISSPIMLNDQIVVISLKEETQMSEEEWKAYNDNLYGEVSSGQFNSMALINIVNGIYRATQNYSYSLGSYQFVMYRLMARSESEDIPFSYMLYSFITEYSDFDWYIQLIRSDKLDDQFNSSYQRITGQAG